ncbi:MAG: hypothetical protein JSV49_10475 [Thermoplasmata archaeon]|nr:MAG: hypothetical protein JSV49_10475 [Thermoplasmata archaeon]
MSLDDEKLITKIQLEYTMGSDPAIAHDTSSWDVGLLYLTTNNLWFVNRKKERSQVTFNQVLSVSDVYTREGMPTTKFTKVLGANHLLTIKYQLGEVSLGTKMNIYLAAPSDVLSALRSHLVVRTDKPTERTVGTLKLNKPELMKRLSVFLSLDIKNEEQLKFFLGLEQTELINLLLERSHISQPI